MSKASIFDPLCEEWKLGPWCTQNAGQYRIIPGERKVKEGSRSREISPHPPRIMAGRETKVCHLLAGIPSVNAEMVFIPTEDELFIRGFSKR